MTKVVLETGKNRRSMTRQAMVDLGDGLLARVKAAKTIFIKPNLLHHERSLAVTHVDAVRGILDYIREHSRARVLIGDGSMTGTEAAFRHFGYDLLPEEYEKVELVDLNEDAWVLGHAVRADGSKSEIRRAKTPMECDFKISVAPLKTHAMIGLSGAVESWVMGTWVVPPRISPMGRVWARWPWLENEGVQGHHASIANLYAEAPCNLAVVDGIMAMQGEGPLDGEAAAVEVVIASLDPLAADSVAATIMGLDAYEIGYLAMLAQQHLGVIDIPQMDIPPAVLDSVQRTFLMPHGLPERLRQFTLK